MKGLYRNIKADFIKLKGTPIIYIHILIPIIGAMVFLLYYSVSSWDNIKKLATYFQVLASVFPLLIGIITGIVIGQEEQAGNFQNMLSIIKSRNITYFSKLIVLLILSIFSVTITICTFAVGFKNYSFDIYIKLGCALFLGNVFLYILHIFISFRFGKGASIGLGIVGVLISSLMETGLGDGIWHMIPWGWAVRFCDLIILSNLYEMDFIHISTNIIKGIWILIIDVFIILILNSLWFKRWEGNKSYD